MRLRKLIQKIIELLDRLQKEKPMKQILAGLVMALVLTGCGLTHQQEVAIVAASTYTSATVAFIQGDKADSATCRKDAAVCITVCDAVSAYLAANPAAMNQAATSVQTSGMLLKLPAKLQGVITTVLVTMSGRQDDIQVALAQVRAAANDYLSSKTQFAAPAPEKVSP